MKVKLEFIIPDEQEEFTHAITGSTYNSILFEFNEFLHRRYKHSDPASDDTRKEYEEICKEFHDKLDEFDITLY